MEDYISFEHVSKVFPGQKALDDVSFGVRKGEIHALIGENGAGKSTLLNILHGMFPATSGKIFIGGEQVEFSNALEAIRYGIAKVHQEINIIPELTVTQNIMLGTEPTKYGLLNDAHMRKETQRLLNLLGCKFSPDDKMKTLSTGKKQMVQIAKALFLNAKVISFDEPTSSLSNAEVDMLFKIIRDLQEKGITILYISHKMNEIFELCERASILRDGKFVATMDLKSTTQDALVHNMVGRDVALFAQRKRPLCATNDIVLSVKNLSGDAGFFDVSFDLRKGEILGFFGLVGAMRTEVMRAIFGADKASGGEVIHNGKPLTRRTPSSAVDNGIGLISENRKEEGFVKTLTNADNIALASVKKYMRGPFVDQKLKSENSVRVGAMVGLHPNDPDFMTMSLSGGNAQKVILAKWLSTDADILILDEPTKGIDIGAKAEIYNLMEDIVAQGKSIIMVSSELTEVMSMSDRIIVMREGHLVSQLDRNEFSEAGIITLAVGGTVHA